MIEDIKLNISTVETEKTEIIKIYKTLLDDYRQIKRYVERANWNDEKYYYLVESLNTIGKALSNALHTLTNGNDVYIIDDLIFWTDKYLENKNNFPQI